MDYLEIIRRKLDLPPADKEQVLKELESHYRDAEQELLASGVGPCEAATEVARRMGDPSDLVREMQAVHLRLPWKDAIGAANPLLLLILPAIIPYRLPDSVAMIMWPVYYVILTLRICRTQHFGLPTWIPAGAVFATFTGFLRWQEVFPTVDRWEHPVALALRLFVQVLIIGIGAVVMLRKKRRLMCLTMAAAAVSIAVELWLQTVLPGHTRYASPVLASIPLVTLAAMALFAWHPHGSPSDASLFLFSYYIAAYPKVVIAEPPANLLPLVVYLLAALGTVVACARSGSIWGKQLTIAGGLLFCISLIEWSPSSILHIGYVADGGQMAVGVGFACLVAAWTVLVPMWLRRSPAWAGEDPASQEAKA